MRLLLVSPTPYDINKLPIRQHRKYLPGLTMPHLAALTPDEFDVHIVDQTTEEIPYDEDWDVVGIGTNGCAIVTGWDISKEFKERGVPTIIGGIGASHGGIRGSQEYCDSLVIGEAENNWLEVLWDLQKGQLKPEYIGELADISNLPIPRYDLLDRKKIGFWLPVQAARGCTHHCTFCSVTSANQGTYRKRPVDQIIRDIEVIINMGFKRVAFVDDNITLDPSFLADLCRAMIPLKIHWMSQCTISAANNDNILDLMAQSGCVMVSIGFDGVNQGSLNSIKKGFNKVSHFREQIKNFRSYGIDVSSEMIIGLDEDTDEVYEAVYHFVMDNHISVPRIHIITPIPGTPLWKEWSAAGRILDYDFSHYTGSRLVVRPKHMTMESVEANYWQLYQRLFTLPAILRRFLGSRPTRGFMVNLFALGANFHYLNHIRHRIPPGIV